MYFIHHISIMYKLCSSIKENICVWFASQSGSRRCVFHASKMHLKVMVRHYNWDHGQIKMIFNVSFWHLATRYGWFELIHWIITIFYRQSVAPSVVGSLNEKDEKAKKAKQPIVIWPEWTEQDIAQEKWVRLPTPLTFLYNAY